MFYMEQSLSMSFFLDMGVGFYVKQENLKELKLTLVPKLWKMFCLDFDWVSAKENTFY